jgi:hypothetical protein
LLLTGTVLAHPPANLKVAAPGPSGLQVLSASLSKVQLVWTPFQGATDYVVERGAEAGPFAAAGAITKDPDFTDAKIDPYTIYTYRVKAVLGPQKTSGPSNEVKAGPPPTGFNVVTLTPKDREPDFGYAMTMVLDGNEDPVFAYTFRDPNNKNKRTDNQLFFGGWDRANYSWREPVQVDVIGDFWSDTVRPIALALDASTGQFGLAYVRSSGPGRLHSQATAETPGSSKCCPRPTARMLMDARWPWAAGIFTWQPSATAAPPTLAVKPANRRPNGRRPECHCRRIWAIAPMATWL